MGIEIYTAKTALGRIKSMTVPEALSWSLEWHKSDFGHDCNAMLEAESAAFQYFGEKMLKLLQAPDCLTLKEVLPVLGIHSWQTQGRGSREAGETVGFHEGGESASKRA